MFRSKSRSIVILVLVALLTGALGVSAQDGQVTFMSTQFNIVEESDKIRTILADYGEVEFVPSEEGSMIDLLRAEAETGEGTVDLIGALHGTYPVLQAEDVLFDLSDLLARIEENYELPESFVTLGKLGTEDYQYYIPWMQATYIMAAHVSALDYLPEGADINALTWEQFAEWAKNIYDGTGEAQTGLPVAGLFHRFLEGYLYPSFTGGMVTGFKSPEAVAMWEWFRDDLWPYIHPQSVTSYEFMQEPLLAGEVILAFDHTARLINAFNEKPEEFVGFPAPTGPAGLGFMPVVAGLAVPYTSPNPDGAEALIEFLLLPETQSRVLQDLAFFPVVGGVDTSNLPAGVAIEAAAVEAQAASPDALPALLPVGLGDRGGEINEIYRNAFSRIVLNGEDIQTVLDAEGAALQALMDETGAPCWPPDAVSEGACQLQ
ncbi:MAG: carbohydrate ABC transporter substrate-binding protein [Chloroflexi bacterium]|nr:carbohydrate ABC transporter substrate-binding protein [Chloroflexota bacterium]